jgi:NADPH2:quinone reductase
VDTLSVGDAVWVWEAAFDRTEGTAQEFTVLPADRVVALPDPTSYDLGASLGIPFLTAHRCLTTLEGGPSSLGPGSLEGRTILVAGGAGAVGNAAIQLARWSSANVISTVSGPEKELLALAAGSHHVVNYRTADTVTEIRNLAPHGVDCIVEVAPDTNSSLDAKVIASHGTIAIYAMADALLPARILVRNARIQYVLVYTVPPPAKRQAVRDVSAALRDRALGVGPDKGLPLHHFRLSQTAEALNAVERGAVGKVLIDVSD